MNIPQLTKKNTKQNKTKLINPKQQQQQPQKKTDKKLITNAGAITDTGSILILL